MKNDLKNRRDVELMVNTFYNAVRADNLLAPIFNSAIGDQWKKHQEKMYKFWQTVLLHELAYKGSPFISHRKLPIGKEHFDRWIQLFKASIDMNFEGEIAEEAKWRADKMAQMFMYKLNADSY